MVSEILHARAFPASGLSLVPVPFQFRNEWTLSSYILPGMGTRPFRPRRYRSLIAARPRRTDPWRYRDCDIDTETTSLYFCRHGGKANIAICI